MQRNVLELARLAKEGMFRWTEIWIIYTPRRPWVPPDGRGYPPTAVGTPRRPWVPPTAVDSSRRPWVTPDVHGYPPTAVGTPHGRG